MAITPALDPLLVAAAEVLREEAPKQLDILRAAAEKWIGGIVALYTLFGLASISIAKDSIAPLPTVARIAVALLVLIALTQAAFAVYCAYRGAYGLPVIHQVNNDDELREWYQQRAAAPSRVAHFVKRAVAAALGSLAALTLAVGVIWLTTPKDVLGPVVKLTMRDDSQACGTLLPTTSPDASGALRLRRADDGSVLQLPAGGFKAITPVKAC
jgi:uncharacterized membrane protein